MQEEQTVAFHPMEIYIHWYTALFRLYLVVVILLATFRFAQLLWFLRKKRMSEQADSLAGLSLTEYWSRSYINAKSFKNLSILTFLLAVTVLGWTLHGDLIQIATQRTSGVGAVAGALADSLKTFTAGMIVSTALFSCGGFCEGLITRRRLALRQEEQSSTARSRFMRTLFRL